MDGVNEVVLSVMSCSDAQIYLSRYPGVVNHQAYIIQIGSVGNTRTTLRDAGSGSVLTEVSSPNVLNCSVVRPFWVTWKGDQLSFGSGSTPGQGRMLTYMDPQGVVIRSVSLNTPVGMMGIWVFIGYIGMTLTY